MNPKEDMFGVFGVIPMVTMKAAQIKEQIDRVEAEARYRQYRAAGQAQPNSSAFTIPFEEFSRMDFRDMEQMRDYFLCRARMFSLIQPDIEYEVSLIMEGCQDVRVEFRPGRRERERQEAAKQEEWERQVRKIQVGIPISQMIMDQAAQGMANDIDRKILDSLRAEYPKTKKSPPSEAELERMKEYDAGMKAILDSMAPKK